MAKKVLIRNTQSPGDLVVLTAAVRDLHRCYPGKFETAVDVSKGASGVFSNTPHVVARNGFHRRHTFVAKYPLIHQSNQQHKHFLWGFIEYMNSALRLDIKLTEFRPALYLTEMEMATPLPGLEKPYWVFLSGGKKDFTTKLWAQSYWQQVVNMTRDRINWVQAGTPGHYNHIAKEGIYANMIGKTGLRQFMRLIYHAQGVVCVITAAMHIAAAFNKPCVVIAGGREPWWWEAYNSENRVIQMRHADPTWHPPADDDFIPHKFLHTMGQLDCCENIGCWKEAIEQNRPKKKPCKYPAKVGTETIPECKKIITPEMVVKAIDEYHDAGIVERVRNTVTQVPVVIPEVNVSCGLCVEGAPTPDVTKWLQNILMNMPAKSIVAHISPEPDDTFKALALQGGAEYRLYEHKMNAVREVAGRHELFAWFEPGSAPQHLSWLEDACHVLGDKTVYGRAHRTFEQQHYPYPGFFLARSDKLKLEESSFLGMFKDVAPDQYQPVTGGIHVAATPVPA